MSLQQVETLLLLSSTGSSGAPRKNRFHEGSTAGTALAGVKLLPLADRWALPASKKQQIFNNIPNHSGKPEEEVVVNEDCFSPELVGEFLHRTRAICLLHLSVTDDVAAVAALEGKVPYVGVVSGPEHASALIQRLHQKVFNAFLNPKSRFYKEELAKLLKKGQKQPAAKTDPPESKAKAKAKAKSKSKADKKTKSKSAEAKTKAAAKGKAPR